MDAESLVFVQDGCPIFIRVEAFHLHELIERFVTEVFFVDHAILADDERLDTGDGVLREVRFTGSLDLSLTS